MTIRKKGEKEEKGLFLVSWSTSRGGEKGISRTRQFEKEEKGGRKGPLPYFQIPLREAEKRGKGEKKRRELYPCSFFRALGMGRKREGISFWGKIKGSYYFYFQRGGDAQKRGLEKRRRKSILTHIGENNKDRGAPGRGGKKPVLLLFKRRKGEGGFLFLPSPTRKTDTEKPTRRIRKGKKKGKEFPSLHFFFPWREKKKKKRRGGRRIIVRSPSWLKKRRPDHRKSEV